MARTVARPDSSRATVAGATGGAGPSIESGTSVGADGSTGDIAAGDGLLWAAHAVEATRTPNAARNAARCVTRWARSYTCRTYKPFRLGLRPGVRFRRS